MLRKGDQAELEILPCLSRAWQLLPEKEGLLAFRSVLQQSDRHQRHAFWAYLQEPRVSTDSARQQPRRERRPCQIFGADAGGRRQRKYQGSYYSALISE